MKKHQKRNLKSDKGFRHSTPPVFGQSHIRSIFFEKNGSEKID
jgi:hypothetical protein